MSGGCYSSVEKASAHPTNFLHEIKTFLERGSADAFTIILILTTVMEQSKSVDPPQPPEELPFIPPRGSKEAYCATVGETETKIVLEQMQNGQPSQDKKKGFCGPYTGILLALMAGFIFTVGTIFAKYMRGYHPFTLATYRLQGILIPSICMVLYSTKVKKLNVFEPVWPVKGDREKIKTFLGIILRASIGCTALYLHFYALQYLQVGDVAVVHSCKPIFVTLAAFLLLGEALGIFPVFLALLTIIGVGVITRPPILTGSEEFDTQTLIGAGFALGSVVTDTMVVIIVRHLKRIHVSLMMLFLGIWGSMQSILCAYMIDELKLPQSEVDWALAFGMAAVSILNQAGMHLALQYEQANPVAVTRTMDFIFAFGLQFFIMGVEPDLFSLSGAAIIIMCVILTAFRKWLITLPKVHPARKHFWFVLK